MNSVDFIIISQSEVVDYSAYSKLPIDRISLYSKLVYPRMVRYRNSFHSHLDLLNYFVYGKFWKDADYEQRRKMFSIWNLQGFVGPHLANYLQQFGFNTFVINNIDAEWDIFRTIYEENDPSPLVGISTTFHLNYSEIHRLTKWLKSVYPEISIALGGAFINGQIVDSSSISLKQAMHSSGIKYALYGFNSESDLKDLLVWRKSGKGKLQSVRNLITQSASKKSNPSHMNSGSSWNEPLLDSVNAHYCDFRLPFLSSTFQLRTSSGCPFSCAFCSYPESAKGFHLMSIEAVEEQIKSVMKIPGVNKIIFIDDTFNVPRRRFHNLCKIFAKYNFEWFSFLRIQFIDDETAKLMKDSGCQAVYLGIESANDLVLKNMNKQADRKQFSLGLESLKKFGITTLAAFVIGFPGETEKSLRDNIEFIESHGIEFYTLKEFYYLKDTSVHQKRELYGLTGSGDKWTHHTMDSELAYKHKISMFKQIKQSTFIDSDTSLWYLAYLYDMGYSMTEIADFQREINLIVASQIDGTFDDNHPSFIQLQKKLNPKKGCIHEIRNP